METATDLKVKQAAFQAKSSSRKATVLCKREVGFKIIRALAGFIIIIRPNTQAPCDEDKIIVNLQTMRTLTSNNRKPQQQNVEVPGRTAKRPLTAGPWTQLQHIKPSYSNKSPGNDHMRVVSNDTQEKRELSREKSFNILNHLDRREPELQHQYRRFENHSKASDLNEVREIILELLNKHAIDGQLTSSEQYILTGYFAKYIEFAAFTPRLIRNPFNISKRLLTNNSPDMATEPYVQSPSPRRTPKSMNKVAPKFKSKNNIEEMKGVLTKELEMVKFLWQIYTLKTLTCPNLSKLSVEEETSNRRELLDIFNRLKTIELKRGKLGEEKALAELGKVMKRFKIKITTSLL